MGKKKIFVQLWDCPNCGHKGLNALVYKECPDCAQVLSDDFLKNTDYVESVEVDENDPQYKQALEGPDWLCPVCGKRNPARYENCTCGNSRSEISGAVGAVDEKNKTTGGIKNWFQDGSQLEGTRARTEKAAAEKKSLGKFLVIGGISLVAALIFILFFWKFDVNVTAQSLNWERAVDVQIYKEIIKTDWEDRLPSSARILSRTREIFGYNKVKIGENTVTEQVTKTRQEIKGYQSVTRKERRGNGTVEEVTSQEPIYENITYTENVDKIVPVYRDDPIYKYKYVFSVDEWVADRQLVEKGVDSPPYWPESSLKEVVNNPRIGDRRIGTKTETYKADFRDSEGKNFSQTLSLEKWSSITKGTTYQGKKAILGNLDF